MSEQVLSFEQHEVGVCMFEGVPYFRATDVTTAMGYSNGPQAVRAHVNTANTKTFDEVYTGSSSVSADSWSQVSRVSNTLSAAIVQNTSTALLTRTRGLKKPTYLNEAGVYELVWHSKKPVALRFREWVLSEVLPEIRKTGPRSGKPDSM